MQMLLQSVGASGATRQWTLLLVPCSTTSDGAAARDQQKFWCVSSHCVTGVVHDALKRFLGFGNAKPHCSITQLLQSLGSPGINRRCKCHGRCGAKHLQWRAHCLKLPVCQDAASIVSQHSSECHPCTPHSRKQPDCAAAPIGLSTLYDLGCNAAATLQPCSPMTPRKSSRMVPTQNCMGKA